MSVFRERLGDALSDLRLAARALARTPSFTAVAVVVLGLAIGANVAIYSIVDAVLVDPLPLPRSEQLVAARGIDEQGQRQYLSYPDFEDLRARTDLFEAYSAFVPQSVNLTGREAPERIRGGFVSDDFFVVVGVEPALGRGFRPGVDDRAGAERVCVLERAAWQRLFGGDADILGRAIRLNNEPFTVIGVMPEGFRFPLDDVEVWIPHQHWPVYRSAVADGSAASRTEGLVGGVGRLRPGIAPAAAEMALGELFARLSNAHPEGGERSVALEPLKEQVVGDARQPVLVLFGAVGLVLVVACANIAGLLVVRNARRRRELATRAALGAGRGRLSAQLLAETLLLWSGGAGFGLLLGEWFRQLLLAAAPTELPGGLEARFDFGVAVFLLAVTALTALAFGAMPAMRASGTDPAEALASGSRGALGAASSLRLRSALVAGQVALTLVLLVGSGLLLRSFVRLAQVDPGFGADGVLSMEYRLPQNKYGGSEAQWQVHRRILERVREVPGARSAALVSGLPFSGNGGTVGFRPLGGETSDEMSRARALTVSSDYFRTLGIELVRGRPLGDEDRADTRPVVVVSRRLAERWFAGDGAIGRRLAIGADGGTFEVEIVGVVADVKQYALDEDELPAIYGAQAQNPGIFNTLAVRADGDPLQLAEAVRAAVWSVDPEQPVWKVRTLESLVERSLGLPRFLARLMGVYAAAALLLAAIGIFGVVATQVAQRRGELGLRVALGAQRRDVVRLVVGQGLRWTALGIAAGLAAALALGRVVNALLYRTDSADPAVLLIVVAALGVVATGAAYLPARAAAGVDPAGTLRAE